MTIDNRYKKVVEKKLQLQKLLMAQTIFHLVKAVQVVLMAMNGEHVTSTTIATCTFGGAAILTGTIGLRRTSSKFLQFFVFTTCATLMLAFIPLLSGQFYSKVSKTFQASGNYKLLVFDGLEVAQEIIGVVVQLFEVLVSLSLLQLLSRKRA